VALVAAVLALVVGVLVQITRNGGGDAPPATAATAAAETVPGLVGLTRDAAEDRAASAGFDVFFADEVSPGTPSGLVARQSPGAGEEAPRGSRIVAYLSTGPPPLVVPDVRGLPLTGARQVLNNAGLRIGRLSQSPSPSPPGVVVAQTPRGGAGVDPGTEVALTLSAE
jgi:serine/threonine-protein kinase